MGAKPLILSPLSAETTRRPCFKVSPSMSTELGAKMQLVDGFAKLGLMDWADPDSTEPAPSNLMTGLLVLELTHADPSMATFFGVHSGLGMGSIIACGSEEQKRRWLPAMSRFEKIGAFAFCSSYCNNPAR